MAQHKVVETFLVDAESVEAAKEKASRVIGKCFQTTLWKASDDGFPPPGDVLDVQLLSKEQVRLDDLNTQISELYLQISELQEEADSIGRWETGLNCFLCHRDYSILWSPAYLRSLMGPNSMIRQARYVENPEWCVECWKKRNPQGQSMWEGRIRYDERKEEP